MAMKIAKSKKCGSKRFLLGTVGGAMAIGHRKSSVVSGSSGRLLNP